MRQNLQTTQIKKYQLVLNGKVIQTYPTIKQAKDDVNSIILDELDYVEIVEVE